MARFQSATCRSTRPGFCHNFGNAPARFGAKRDEAGLFGEEPVPHLSSRVFVGNVPVDSVQRLQLHARFSKYGIVTEVIIHRKGFAFVQFKNPEDALAAIKGEHGSYLEGNKIGCELTKHENKGGPSRNPSKEIVIGNTGDGDHKTIRVGEQKPPFGHPQSIGQKDAPKQATGRNWQSGGVVERGGGDAEMIRNEVKQDWETEQDWDTETQVSPPPPPPPPPLVTKQDHSLTLGQFIKKDKKPGAKGKLVPFKKKTEISKSIPEENISVAKAKPLRSRSFSGFKFSNGLAVSSTPEEGPFQELWDCDFPDESGDGKSIPNQNGTDNLHEQVFTESCGNQEVVWEDEVPFPQMTPPASPPGKVNKSCISAESPVQVEVPVEIIQEKQIDVSEELSWDDDNEPDFIPQKLFTGKKQHSNCVEVPVEMLQSNNANPNSPNNRSASSPLKPPNDNQDEESWGEEVDVVGTPDTSPLAPIPPKIQGKVEDERLWIDEANPSTQDAVRFSFPLKSSHQEYKFSFTQKSSLQVNPSQDNIANGHSGTENGGLSKQSSQMPQVVPLKSSHQEYTFSFTQKSSLQVNPSQDNIANGHSGTENGGLSKQLSQMPQVESATLGSHPSGGNPHLNIESEKGPPETQNESKTKVNDTERASTTSTKSDSNQGKPVPDGNQQDSIEAIIQPSQLPNGAVSTSQTGMSHDDTSSPHGSSAVQSGIPSIVQVQPLAKQPGPTTGPDLTVRASHPVGNQLAACNSMQTSGNPQMIPFTGGRFIQMTPATNTLLSGRVHQRFGPPEPAMATNFMMPVGQPPVGQPPVAPAGPPPPVSVAQPPHGAPQAFPVGSVQPIMPQRASQNLTYGSLYPSRPVSGTVTGYMAYHSSMGGQPMYQQGRPVQLSQPPSAAHVRGQPVYQQSGPALLPTPPTSSCPVSPGGQVMPMNSSGNQVMPMKSSGGQALPVNASDQQRQRQLSAQNQPPAYNSMYMQQQANGSYSTPPLPSPNGQRDRHLSGQSTPSPAFTPPPSIPSMPSQQGRPMNGQQQPPMQVAGNVSQPMTPVTYSYQPVQTPASGAYMSSSHPYGSGMKNLTMSASIPLDRQIGFRDSSFPLTDIEKSKINSEFKQALQAAEGPLEVTDNTLLRIFMVLPEPIRRGIKRTGGLKAYLQQSEAFEVRGDMVSLPGQMKDLMMPPPPPPGSYQPRKQSGLNSTAREFFPGDQSSGQTSSSSGRKQTEGTFTNIQSSTRFCQNSVPGTGRQSSAVARSQSSTSLARSHQDSVPGTGRSQSSTSTTRSRHGSVPGSGRLSSTVVRSRHASVPDSVKAAADSMQVEDNGEDGTVYKLVTDAPVKDDLWELDSFLTEAYGGGYYKDYLALSKELEKKTSQEASITITSKEKGNTELQSKSSNLQRDSTQVGAKDGTVTASKTTTSQVKISEPQSQSSKPQIQSTQVGAKHGTESASKTTTSQVKIKTEPQLQVSKPQEQSTQVGAKHGTESASKTTTSQVKITEPQSQSSKPQIQSTQVGAKHGTESASKTTTTSQVKITEPQEQSSNPQEQSTQVEAKHELVSASKTNTSQVKIKTEPQLQSSKPEGQSTEAGAKHGASSDEVTNLSTHTMAKCTSSSYHQTKESSGKHGANDDTGRKAQQVPPDSSTIQPSQDLVKKCVDIKQEPKNIGEQPATKPVGECPPASVLENECMAQVIDSKKFEKKTATTFAAKLLEAASKHSEKTSERTDATNTSGQEVWDSNKSLVKGSDSESEKKEIQKVKASQSDSAVVGDSKDESSDVNNKSDGKEVNKEEGFESSGSWSTVSDDSQGSPQRFTKRDIVDQFLFQEMTEFLTEVGEILQSKSSAKKSRKSTKAKDSGAHDKLVITEDACPDITATGPSGDTTAKTSRGKVRCAAVFDVSNDGNSELIQENSPGDDKAVADSHTDDADSETEKMPSTKASFGNSQDDVTTTDEQTEKVSDIKEAVASFKDGVVDRNRDAEVEVLAGSKDDAVDNNTDATVFAAEVEKVPDTEESIIDSKNVSTVSGTDATQMIPGNEQCLNDSKDGEDAQTEKNSDCKASVTQGDEEDKCTPTGDVVTKGEGIVASETSFGNQADQTQSDTTQESITGAAAACVENTLGCNLQNSIQEVPHVTDDSRDNPGKVSPSASSKPEKSPKDKPIQSQVEEELIVQSQVAGTSTGNYFKDVNVDNSGESSSSHHLSKTNSVAVNTNIVKTVNKGVVTSKVAKISRVTSTIAVTTVTRGVGTFEDFDESYRTKNMELESKIRLLEESLESERDQSTLQKHSFQVEIRSLRDSLENLACKKNEIEDQLKIKKRQQAVEMRKTSAELRDTDARYSAQKTKVQSLEKENACITRELSAITRELFDLQATVEADTVRQRSLSVDETTSTEDLEEAQRKKENAKEERTRALYERAQLAEVKVLKLQLESCQQAIHKTQQQSQYTYNVFANSPQISAHEKLCVNSQWTSYQSQVQEAIQQLLTDYERKETLMKEGTSLAELPPLQVPHLEAFTPRTGMPPVRAIPSPLVGLAPQGSTDTASYFPRDDNSSVSSSDQVTTASTETISDAGLDELKSMTSRLLQPDLDLAKPTASIPNVAGPVPLFSLGSLYGQQQPSSVRHPYNRESREARLRAIQRRLGVNPDTGKPLAAKSHTSSAFVGSNGAAPGTEPSSSSSRTTSGSQLGSGNALSFAMKQRSLANTYRKRQQSSSSDDNTMASSMFPQQLPMASTGVPPVYPSSGSMIPRARSVSSPTESTHSRPEIIANMPEESTKPLPEPTIEETSVNISTNRVQQSQAESNQPRPKQEIDPSFHTRTTQATATKTEPPKNLRESARSPADASGPFSYQANSFQQGLSSGLPAETQPEFSDQDSTSQSYQQQRQQQWQQQQQQRQQQQWQQQQQSLGDQQIRQLSSDSQVDDGTHNKQWESEYTTQQDNTAKTHRHPSGSVSDQATQPVSESQLPRKAVSCDSYVEEKLEKPSKPEASRASTDIPSMNQFPKSDAIKAARSTSPTDQLEESWANLPPQLKARLGPRLTRSGGVTLKPLVKSQEVAKPSSSGSKFAWDGIVETKPKGGKRKGSTEKEQTTSGLSPIDDVEGEGWTTVIGKKKKKALDSVEEQQHHLQDPKPPSKTGSGGSLDKIHSALARQFPGITRNEVMDTMKQVRIDHRGSLSGVSMAVIVKEASSHIKNTNTKYMVSKSPPAKHEECDDMCVICQDGLRALPGGSTRGNSGNLNTKIRMLDCGHMFHEECIKLWYHSRERTCPICRCHTLLPDDFPALTSDAFPPLIPD